MIGTLSRNDSFQCENRELFFILFKLFFILCKQLCTFKEKFNKSIKNKKSYTKIFLKKKKHAKCVATLLHYKTTVLK